MATIVHETKLNHRNMPTYSMHTCTKNYQLVVRSQVFFFGQVILSVMSLASIVVFYTLTMDTIAHADRGRPTLKDDERFRNGLFRDLNENAKIIYMNAKTIYMNSKRKKLNRNTSINLKTMLYENSCLMSLDCSNAVNRSRKKQKVPLIGKHDAVLILHEDTRYMNAGWKYVTSICIEVTVIFVICFIFACIFVYCGTNVMQNKVYAIQEFIFSSSVYLLSIVLPSDIPISLEDPKFSQLSVQVDSVKKFWNKRM